MNSSPLQKHREWNAPFIGLFRQPFGRAAAAPNHQARRCQCMVQGINKDLRRHSLKRRIAAEKTEKRKALSRLPFLLEVV
jgi:hypothetical protein